MSVLAISAMFYVVTHNRDFLEIDDSGNVGNKRGFRKSDTFVQNWHQGVLKVSAKNKVVISGN